MSNPAESICKICQTVIFVIVVLGANSAITKELHCQSEILILGTAQDAGKPQIGHHDDPAWRNKSQARMASSLALIDANGERQYLFDASPDIKRQLYLLDQQSEQQEFRLDGVFLTHAHMGHYLGLAQLGREAMGAQQIPVFVMPKMLSFLRRNAPWSLLVKLKNIELQPLAAQNPIVLSDGLKVTPFLVPHRAEFTETVGFQIQGKSRSAIYLPDIDSWEQWDALGIYIEDVIAANDILFLDATFFSGDELPGRDMTKIPHPTISHSMRRFANLPTAQKAKIKFTHLNHSNPAHSKTSAQAQAIRAAGFGLAQRGEAYCLD